MKSVYRRSSCCVEDCLHLLPLILPIYLYYSFTTCYEATFAGKVLVAVLVNNEFNLLDREKETMADQRPHAFTLHNA